MPKILATELPRARSRSLGLLIWGAAAAPLAWGGDPEGSPRPLVPAVAPAASQAAKTATQPAPEPAKPDAERAEAKPTVWEGAFGLTASYRPEYSGSSKWIAKLSPGLFLRYGRFTITNASGFVTRRADDVVRGLGMDMVRSEAMRVNLALRVDQGRSEGTSTALQGMGDIRPTIRGRLQASWRLPGPWRVGASWSVDLLGKGGGNFGDIGGGLEIRVTPSTVVSAGMGLSAAGDRYMQTWYGVNEAQASRTGYAVYEPKAGLRDMSVYANIRHDIGEDWILLGSVGASRLLGPAAASPLTGNKSGWGLSTGLARRF